MKPSFSLFWQLVIGSLLWTAGLVVVVNHISLSLVQHQVNGPLLHVSAMFLLGVGSLSVGLVQVKRGMSSLRRLRTSLTAVRDGVAPRVAGTYATEIQPVVDDLNQLLDLR